MNNSLAWAAFMLAAMSVQAVIAGDVDYQKAADTASWGWPAEEADPFSCFGQSQTGYGLRIDIDADRRSMVRHIVTRGGKDLAGWSGHPHSTFRILRDCLYYAEFSPTSPGGTIVAVELPSGRERWRMVLTAAGANNLDHSTYANRVALDVNHEVVRVVGDETNGRYIEFKDVRSGETVGHKLFPRAPATQPAG